MTASPIRSSGSTTVRKLCTVCLENFQRFESHQLGRIAQPHHQECDYYNCICGLFLFSPSNNMHAWHIAWLDM